MQCDARCKSLVQCVVSCEKLYCNASQNVNIWCKADMQLSEEDVKLYAGHMQLYMGEISQGVQSMEIMSYFFFFVTVLGNLEV